MSHSEIKACVQTRSPLVLWLQYCGSFLCLLSKDLKKNPSLIAHPLAYTEYLQHTRMLSPNYFQLIDSGSTKPEVLFSTINTLLKPIENTLSSFTTNKCNSFLSFFQTKIDKIDSNLSTSIAPNSPPLLQLAPCMASVTSVVKNFEQSVNWKNTVEMQAHLQL